MYPLLTTVFGFLFLRLIHGFSTGFTPTGEAAYISDIIPAERRGEAMGLMGTTSSLGMASGPAIGGWLSSVYSLEVMFYCSSAFALMAALTVVTIRETVRQRQPISWKLLHVSKVDLFEPRVLMPCIVMGLCAYAYGGLFTIMSDYGAYFHIENKGLLFTYFTVASLFVRLIAGRASDKYGRVQVLKVSTAVMTIACLVIGLADTKLMLIVGICLYGMAQERIHQRFLPGRRTSATLTTGAGASLRYIFLWKWELVSVLFSPG